MRAAIKVFAGYGYFNSKVSDIAGEAGIADGTVYLYFKSKDEILHSIFDRAMEEFIDEGKRELAEIAEPAAKLKRIAEIHLEKLGAKLTVLSKKQADYIGVPTYGPFKPSHHRYQGRVRY